MGQRQSHPIDLSNRETCTLNQKVITVVFRPIYLLTTLHDQEQCLRTGSKELDQLVIYRIQQYIPTLTRLISQVLNFQSITTMQDDSDADQNIYVTLEKQDQSIILPSECDQIRQFFHEYNQLTHTPILMTEHEASSSAFFDDMGDIRLGFKIEQSIDYL